jgi:hypothetical protein
LMLQDAQALGEGRCAMRDAPTRSGSEMRA